MYWVFLTIICYHQPLVENHECFITKCKYVWYDISTFFMYWCWGWHVSTRDTNLISLFAWAPVCSTSPNARSAPVCGTSPNARSKRVYLFHWFAFMGRKPLGRECDTQPKINVTGNVWCSSLSSKVTSFFKTRQKYGLGLKICKGESHKSLYWLSSVVHIYVTNR